MIAIGTGDLQEVGCACDFCRMKTRTPPDSPGLFPDLPLVPDFSLESRAKRKDLWPVAGTDEAGRGPLAGPVVAAAVLLCKPRPSGLDDSKKLTAARRAELETTIKRRCQWAVGVAIGRPSRR